MYRIITDLHKAQYLLVIAPQRFAHLPYASSVNLKASQIKMFSTEQQAPDCGAHLGEHFMIDAYCGSREKLPDRELVQKYLRELPEKFGMQKLCEKLGSLYYTDVQGNSPAR